MEESLSESFGERISSALCQENHIFIVWLPQSELQQMEDILQIINCSLLVLITKSEEKCGIVSFL